VNHAVLRLLSPAQVEVEICRSEELAQLGDADVLVTTYGILRRDIVTLKALPFDYAILDEAQAIKKESAKYRGDPLKQRG
jgi:reverse gyrase